MRAPLLAVALLASCQWVSGLSDIELREPEGAGGGGGDPGSGGATVVASSTSGGGGQGGAAGEAGSGGMPVAVVLVADLVAPTAVAVDDAAIYYNERGRLPGEGVLWRLAKARGATPEPLATGEDFPRALALAAGALFYVVGSSGSEAVVRLELRPTTVRTVFATASSPLSDLKLDATHAFWIDGSSLLRKPLTGGVEELVASASTTMHRIDVNDPLEAYFTHGDALYRVPKVGGGATSLYQNNALTLIVSSTQHVVVSEELLAQVIAVPKTGGVGTPLAMTQAHVQGLAVDAAAGEVFWTSCPLPNAVMHGPIDGSSAPVALQQASGCALGIALDPDNVYWTDRDEGALWRTPR